MKIRLLLILVIAFSNNADSQTFPPDPLPGCESGIQRVGVDQPGGYSTRYWVAGFGTSEVDCEGVSVHISGTMNSDDFAFAIVDVDLFTQTTPEEVDFSIDLTDVFHSLPISQNVSVVQLKSSNALIGELVLRKSSNPAATAGKYNQQTTSAEMWAVKIVWFNDSFTDVTEDSFLFDGGVVVEFNYIWDDNISSMPISMISLGENRNSIDPYTNDNGGITQNANGRGEVTTFNLGLISSEALLADGDQIKFNLSLSQDNNPL